MKINETKRSPQISVVMAHVLPLMKGTFLGMQNISILHWLFADICDSFIAIKYVTVHAHFHCFYNYLCCHLMFT